MILRREGREGLEGVWDRQYCGEAQPCRLSVLSSYLPVLPALITWHPRLHPIRPRVDPTCQAAHPAKAGALQQSQRLHRAGSMMAVGDDLGVSIQLAEPLG